MADPLLLGLYAISQMIKGNRTRTALKEEEEKKRKEAAAAAKAESIVTPYGRTTPDGPIQQLNILDKNFPNYTVTHRRFGTGEIKPVDPDEVTKQLWETSAGVVGTRDELENQIVSLTGTKFGTWDDLGARVIGDRTFKGNSYSTNYVPGYTSAAEKAAKPVFVFEGTTPEGKQVFGKTQAEVKGQGATPGSIGQKSVSPEFAAGLGFNIASLSTAQKSFVPVPEEKTTAKFLAVTKDNRLVVGDTTQEILDANPDLKLEDIGETKYSGETRTGNIDYPFKKEKDEAVLDSYVDAYPLDANGNRIGPVRRIPLYEYNQDRTKFEPTINKGYQVDPTTNRRVEEFELFSASKAKGAIELSQAFFDIKHKDGDGKDAHFVIGKDFKKPNEQLTVFRNWIENLPKDSAGNTDWNKVGLSSPESIGKMRNFAAAKISEVTAFRDPITGEMIPSRDMLADLVPALERNYPVLMQIPGLQQEVSIRAGINARQAIAEATAVNSVSPETGATQDVIVAQIPTQVPATMVDPNADPNEPGIPAKVNLAMPIDPKYKDAADFLIADMSPGGTESEVNRAKERFGALINYKKDPAGNLLKGPQGQLLLADNQPQLDFVNYLIHTKQPDGSNLASLWKNMNRIGTQRTLSNPDLEKQIRVEFNAAVGNDFEKGTALIMAFSPPVAGTNRDALLWRAQNNKDSREFKKEKIYRLGQADSAATAINVIDKMTATFFTEDGQFIDINTSLGQYYVAFDGAVHLFNQTIGSKLPGLKSISQSQAAVAARNTIFGTDERGRRYFTGFSEVPPADVEEIAKQRGYNSAKEFLEDERKAREQNLAEYEKYTAGLDSDDETVKNLALRNYYRFMVAYSMAAAIQGGTGGRTISDQDVQNILKALKMDSIFGQASTELEILNAAKEMLLDIEKHSRAMAAGGMQAYAAMKFQEFSLGNSGLDINADMIASRLAQPGATVDQGVDSSAAEMSDEDKLAKINAEQGKFGETYDTLEDAMKDLGKTKITRILAK